MLIKPAIAATRNPDRITPFGEKIVPALTSEYPNINQTTAKDAREIMILAL
jgi:hypothetical protein